MCLTGFLVSRTAAQQLALCCCNVATRKQVWELDVSGFHHNVGASVGNSLFCTMVPSSLAARTICCLGRPCSSPLTSTL